jgi:hypothetical protein
VHSGPSYGRPGDGSRIRKDGQRTRIHVLVDPTFIERFEEAARAEIRPDRIREAT